LQSNESAADLDDLLKDNEIIESVQRWVESFVVDMNLCPYAKRELIRNRVRFVLTAVETEEELLIVLQAELELLHGDSAIETTLLIHAKVLQVFDDYNQFLNHADKLLQQMGFEGVYQIASFHPHYQFGGTDPDDAENYTNRSPYPMLHIIREDSIARAIADSPNAEQIPVRNIELMNQLGQDKLQALMQACIDGGGKGNLWTGKYS
jgi:hypothetical protein